MSRPRRGMAGKGSGTPHRPKPRNYPDRREAGGNWHDSDLIIASRAASPEVNLWSAVLCMSIHEAINMVRIDPLTSSYTDAVKHKIESYEWVLDERITMGSIIWVLEQIDFLKWLGRIQQFVQDRYVEQPLAPEGYLSSRCVARRRGRPSSREVAPHLACRTPAPEISHGYDDPPIAVPLVAQLPLDMQATQNQSANCVSDEIYTHAQLSEAPRREPLYRILLRG